MPDELCVCDDALVDRHMRFQRLNSLTSVRDFFWLRPCISRAAPDPDRTSAAAEEQIDLAARRGAGADRLLLENFAFIGDGARRLEIAPALG